MARYELVEGKSSKFWEITLEGTAFTITFGRIGTAGQSQTKTFGSAAEAKREHDKLVAEKTKKGYSSVAPEAAGAAEASGRAPTKKRGKPNAATLAASWGREVPVPLAEFLASDDLRALEKRKITIRYAGEHVATLRFEDPAFGDLAEWMEDVGLGDDIDWPNERGEEFKNALPLALLVCDDFERELLSVRTDDPALPVSIFTEGSFFQLWSSLADLVGELRGTRVDPIAALEKQMAVAQKLEDKEKYGDAAAVLEAALGELEASVLAAKDGAGVIEGARHRAGYCRYRSGELEAAERHYTVSAEHGGSAASFNLVLMAVDRKAFALAAERVEKFWDKYAFSDRFRLDAFRHRALAQAMLGQKAKALGALSEIEKQCFERDDFGKEIGRLLEVLDEAGTPPDPAGLDAVAAVKAEASKLAAAWNESRRPKADASPRQWWDGLDEIARMVLKANLKKPDFYQIPYAPDAIEASDAELAEMLALESFRSFTVSKTEPGSFLGEYHTLATLAPLARLTELQSIDLAEAAGPYSLTPLGGLTKLRVLKLRGVKVDDIAPLAGLPIEELVLKDTEVTDLAPLAKLPRLRRLDIWRCPTEDLAPLAACVELRELVAGKTPARELPPLPELAKLEVADFHFSRFGRKDVNAFKKAHPSCKVEYKQAKDG